MTDAEKQTIAVALRQALNGAVAVGNFTTAGEILDAMKYLANGAVQVRKEASQVATVSRRGRKPLADDIVQQLKAYSAEGKRNSWIAKKLGLSTATVGKYLKS